MSYYNILSEYKTIIPGPFSRADIKNALASEHLTTEGFAALLSPLAAEFLEPMAQRAHRTTLKYFGRTIQLYTPIYLSNYCDNRCLYCGFNASNDFDRKRLTLDEVKREAEYIASTGLKHILVLTGDSRKESPVSYIKDCAEILKDHFTSIALEVYALTGEEYAGLISSGVDGLTIYQETYDEALYATLHPSGPKSDFRFRLDAPERGAAAGMRNVNIGVLLGLNDWRSDVLFMALHARYLQDNYPEVEVAVSIPRIRPYAGDFKPSCAVSDADIVQIITALRIFLPRSGITVSTRENAKLRENIIPLGITRMSAGSTTYVGGHTVKNAFERDLAQFDISDKRSVEEIKAILEGKDYQPVLKDWMRI